MMELLFLRYEQNSFDQWFPMLTRSKWERKHDGKEMFLEVRSYFHEVKRKSEECVLEDIIIYNHRASQAIAIICVNDDNLSLKVTCHL